MLITRVGRGLARRCPNCGSRHIFRSWVGLAEACPRCELRYEREQGYWLGAILINTAVTMAVFAAVMILWAAAAWPDPPWTVMTISGAVINLVLPIVFYPYSKTLWVALEITAHPPAGDQADRM